MNNAIMLPYIDKSGDSYMYVPTLFPFREYIIGNAVDYAEFTHKYQQRLSRIQTFFMVFAAVQGVLLNHVANGPIALVSYFLPWLVLQLVVLLFVFGETQRIGLKRKKVDNVNIRHIAKIVVEASDFSKTSLLMNGEKIHNILLHIIFSYSSPYIVSTFPIIILFLAFRNLIYGDSIYGNLSFAGMLGNMVALVYGCMTLIKIGIANYRLHQRPSVE
ncbi:MAG: hypothetical protein M1488_04550 [Gammaproteobacteria bacterium]|jgi:hypothetical protein|nr:hypothetical protein [Gammaproteobacteria bacterium]